MYLLFALFNNFFQIDLIVEGKNVSILNKCVIQFTIILLRTYHTKFVVIQSSNTCDLNSHSQDILTNPNLTSHILHCNETKISNINLGHHIYDVSSSRFLILSNYDGHIE